MYKLRKYMLISLIAVQPLILSAGETDLLIQKLVEKGVLDAGEAQTVLTQTKEELKKNIAQGSADNMPSWVQNIGLKGDLRIRYQTDRAVNAVNRDRVRLRLRVGAETRVTEGWKAAFGLATGSRKTVAISSNNVAGSGGQFDIVDGEPRSTNFTFGDTLSKAGLMVDYAYLQYDPSSLLGFIIGKYKNPIWEPTDLCWDTDLYADGLSVPLAYKFSSNFDLFLTPSYLIIDEISTANDPGILSAQIGCNYAINSNLKLKAAVVSYQTQFIKKGKLDNSAKTNSGATTALANDYNCVSPAVQLDVTSLFGYSLSVFGEYVLNPSSGAANMGIATGLNFGAAKVANKGDWQIRALSRYLETDAFLDTFPDSDAYGGGTNCKGYEAVFTYGLNANLSLSVDYYSMDKITGATVTTPKSLTQVDLVMKF